MFILLSFSWAVLQVRADSDRGPRPKACHRQTPGSPQAARYAPTFGRDLYQPPFPRLTASCYLPTGLTTEGFTIAVKDHPDAKPTQWTPPKSASCSCVRLLESDTHEPVPIFPPIFRTKAVSPQAKAASVGPRRRSLPSRLRDDYTSFASDSDDSDEMALSRTPHARVRNVTPNRRRSTRGHPPAPPPKTRVSSSSRSRKVIRLYVHPRA